MSLSCPCDLSVCPIRVLAFLRRTFGHSIGNNTNSSSSAHYRVLAKTDADLDAAEEGLEPLRSATGSDYGHSRSSMQDGVNDEDVTSGTEWEDRDGLKRRERWAGNRAAGSVEALGTTTSLASRDEGHRGAVVVDMRNRSTDTSHVTQDDSTKRSIPLTTRLFHWIRGDERNELEVEDMDLSGDHPSRVAPVHSSIRRVDSAPLDISASISPPRGPDVNCESKELEVMTSHLYNSDYTLETGEETELEQLEPECVMCLDTFSESNPLYPTVCSCGLNKTMFHLACLIEWTARNSRCPVCRTPLYFEEP